MLLAEKLQRQNPFEDFLYRLSSIVEVGSAQQKVITTIMHVQRLESSKGVHFLMLEIGCVHS